MKSSYLDGLVLNIEFTLISIIQGVALYFLVENAKAPLVGLDFRWWPYAATGLVIILIFWSRSVLHTLTVIRWPLEFGHNFIYVGATLLESVAFTQIGRPAGWYGALAIHAFVVWLLFVFDLRFLRRGTQGELLRILTEDQFQNIRFLVPANVVFNAAAWWAVTHWPDLFVAQGWHWVLGVLQLAASLFYMVSGLRLYGRIAPLIADAKTE